MKSRSLLIKNDRYDSLLNGGSRRYRLTKEQIRALGQGDKIVFDVHVVAIDANCEITFTVFTSTMPDQAPGDSGQVVKLKMDGTGNREPGQRVDHHQGSEVDRDRDAASGRSRAGDGHQARHVVVPCRGPGGRVCHHLPFLTYWGGDEHAPVPAPLVA